MSQQPPAPYSPPPAQPPVPATPQQQPPAGWVPSVPAGPAPGVRYAGNGARFLAWIVDGFIVGIVVTIFYAIGFGVLAAGASADSSAGAGIGLIVMLIGVIVGVAYLPFFWARSGQTIGMKMLRLRLVRAMDGGPLSGGQAVLRLIGYWISAAVFYLGFIWILFDSKRQGWHDKIASTVMIEVA